MLRLTAASVLAFGTCSLVGYKVLVGNLASAHVDDGAALQRADVRALEALKPGKNGEVPFQEVRIALSLLTERPGADVVALINKSRRIEVVGHGGSPKPEHFSAREPRIAAALATGASYAGRETDPGEDPNDFEFVSPVVIGGNRFALWVVYGHGFFDASVDTAQASLGWVALFGLLGGGLIFYLVGGRALLRSHRRALRRARADGLTDMPNQRAFQDDFGRAVESASSNGEPLTLVVMEIDDFRHLNDTRGHLYGDGVLRRVSDVLCAGRVGDRAYRVGGDEFALMLPRADDAGAGRIAARLSRSLNAVETVVSIGMSNLRNGQCADDLRAEAEAALYATKARGGNRVTHFNEIRDRVTVTTSAQCDALRRLLDEDGITSAYQPIWDIGTGVLIGIEALMRPDPNYTVGGPEAAFDAAEQIGATHQLDELCVRSALRIVPDLPPLTLLFVNLAPQTLALDGDDNDWLLTAAQQAGIAPSQIVVEVTERFSGRTSEIIDSLQRLRKQGFKLALDDVGTGNSGLEMLRQVQAEFVKIDRSIVTAAVTEPTARAVLMAMATYASQTNSLVIAEGIEDQDTLEFLTQIDADAARAHPVIAAGQGYGLGRPAPHVPRERPDLLHPRPIQLTS